MYNGIRIRPRKGPALPMRAPPSIPRVLLLVETSRAYGRGILEGIARYARERGSWSIRFEDRGLEPMPCNWLKGWRGDGIISRTVDPSLARALRATRLPIVELHGDRRIGTARVTCDDDEMGRLAVEHLLACGLHDFAVFSYGETWWTRSHCDGFVRAPEQSRLLLPSVSTAAVGWRTGRTRLA